MSSAREINFIVKMRNDARAGMRGVGGDLQQMARQARSASVQARQSIDAIGDASDRTRGRLGGLAGAFRLLGLASLATAALAAGRAVLQAGDHYTELGNRLRSMGVEANGVRDRLRELNQIAASSASDLDSTVTLYTRASVALSEMGAGADETARFVTTWQRAMAVGGASAAEAASATLQFSQALGSGTLRGEEFNAVNEASPYLMRQLAEAMGVPVGALRGMAMQGQITSDVLREAMARMATGVDADFGNMQRTASQAWTGLMNTVQLRLGEAMDAIGGSAGLASVIDGVTVAVNTLATGIGATFQVVGSATGEILQEIWLTIQPIIEALGDWIGATLQVGDGTASMGAVIIGTWRWVLQNIAGAIRWLRENFGEFARYMGEVWRGIGNAIMRPIATAFGMIQQLARASGAAMRGDFEEAGRIAGSAWGNAMAEAARQYPEVRAMLNLTAFRGGGSLQDDIRYAQAAIDGAATSTASGSPSAGGVQPVAPGGGAGASGDAGANASGEHAQAQVGKVAQKVGELSGAMRENISLWDAMRETAKRMGEGAMSTADMMREAWSTTFDRIGQSLSDFAATGELNVRSLVASILSEIARLAASQAWQQLLGTIGGKRGGGGGGWIGAAASFIGGLFHDGGIVGDSVRQARAVHPDVFARARRYHMGGLVDGEVPIIAKRGEAVMPTVRLSNGQLGVQATGAGATIVNSPTYNVNVNVEGGGKGGQEIGEEVSGQVLKQLEKLSRATAQDEIRKAQKLGGMSNWRT